MTGAIPRLGWQESFGLRQNPFRDSLDSDLFFRTRQHEEALIKLRIGIDDGHALILLSGVSGSGKTMVAQVSLRDLDRRSHETALIYAYPGMGKGVLLEALLNELGEERPTRLTQHRLAQIQEKALALHRQGKRLVVVIDEAHFLKADGLHLLRTLANLETEKQKLITVLLIAEPGLKRRLAAPGYAALRGRITFMVELTPMRPEETEQYIKYRILKCGGKVDLLPAGSYPVIHELSRGIPREINRLLYNALMEAMTAAHRAVGPDLLRAVAEQQALAWAR